MNIRDFVPYFIVPLPEGMDETEGNLEQLRLGINERMKGIIFIYSRLSSSSDKDTTYQSYEYTKLSTRIFKKLIEIFEGLNYQSCLCALSSKDFRRRHLY